MLLLLLGNIDLALWLLHPKIVVTALVTHTLLILLYNVLRRGVVDIQDLRALIDLDAGLVQRGELLPLVLVNLLVAPFLSRHRLFRTGLQLLLLP